MTVLQVISSLVMQLGGMNGGEEERKKPAMRRMKKMMFGEMCFDVVHVIFCHPEATPQWAGGSFLSLKLLY